MQESDISVQHEWMKGGQEKTWTYEEESMQLFEDGPLIVLGSQCAETQALAARLVELVHVAEGRDDIFEVDGTV